MGSGPAGAVVTTLHCDSILPEAWIRVHKYTSNAGTMTLPQRERTAHLHALVHVLEPLHAGGRDQAVAHVLSTLKGGVVLCHECIVKLQAMQGTQARGWHRLGVPLILTISAMSTACDVFDHWQKFIFLLHVAEAHARPYSSIHIPAMHMCLVNSYLW